MNDYNSEIASEYQKTLEKEGEKHYSNKYRYSFEELKKIYNNLKSLIK